MSTLDHQQIPKIERMDENEEEDYSEDGGSASENEMNDKEPIRIGPNDTITLDGLLLCPFPGCLKDFSTRWSLNRHSRVHSGVKPYKCNYCSKDFAQNCSLKRHEQTHTQERQWMCSYPNCGKRFKLKEYLEVHHQRSHSKDELMEPIQAPEEKADLAIQAVVNNSTSTIDQLRERLVRMSMRHHDQLYFHQEREQQLVAGMQECSGALDRALAIILALNGGDYSAIPPDMQLISMKYSTQRYPPVASAASAPGSYTYSQHPSFGYPATTPIPMCMPVPLPLPGQKARGVNTVTPTAAATAAASVASANREA